MAAVVLNSEGIPIGSYWGRGGPNSDAMLLDGLRDRCDLLGNSLKFTIAEISVNIRINGMWQVAHGQWPELPPERGLQGSIGPEYDWRDCWEFTGYVPNHAVGVHGVYGAFTRVGRYDLWDQFALSYTCESARCDIGIFFRSGQDDGTPEAALRRAMKHMTRGTGVIGGLEIRCRECWSFYKELRRSCELP